MERPGGGDELTQLIAADDLAVRSMLFSLRGTWLHYQAIGLDADERLRIDVSEEQSLFTAALDTAVAGLGSEEARALALFSLGLVDQVLRRDLAAAAPYFDEALAMLDHVGQEPSLLRSEIVRHVGFDRLLRAKDATAGVELLTTSLSIREQLDEPGWRCSGHTSLSYAMSTAGRASESFEHAQHAVDIAERLDLRTTHLDAARRRLHESRTALNY